MPHMIDPGAAAPLAFDEVVATLEQHGVDFSDDRSLERCAALLAGLSANRMFLGDRVMAEMKASYDRQMHDNRYSAQVLLLHRSGRRWFLRANLWPSVRDFAYAASGPTAFSYDVPHDHNFSFLTVGHLGPGYASDYYEYDADSVDGRQDEPLNLSFVERSSLSPGKMQLYRAHRDIHRQLPPDALSISLNIMEEGEHVPWRDQYVVDLDHGTIARRPTLTQAEMLIRCAVHFSDEGVDLADQFAKAHPVPRVRANAIAALAAVAEGDARAATLERGLRDADARVRGDCARWMALA
jgi:hypothetical protein